MDSSKDIREEGRPADLLPSPTPEIPANPRAGARTIVACTEEILRWRLCRVGLDLDDAIEEEVEDSRRGLRGGRRPVNLSSPEAIAYAEQQPDVALWEGERCLAVIRPRPGGDPEVTRFDGGDDGRPLPEPSTDSERFVWGLVREYGAEPCRVAIVEKFLPNSGRKVPEALTTSERTAVDLVRRFGEAEAMDRLLLAGPYMVIGHILERLGSDAVAELRRIIAAGETPIGVPAATAIGAELAPEAVPEAKS